ncbi:transient receptor potential cation channel subfamily M member 2 isoform X3 [Chelonoidis abingdonii]|uniref:transient receptor potential cation channel subfamily M member 2 isoform X3 n=1 Tax=Chelonoidis abingdonii TaxID=106734 RepID=UPI0013F24A69|nr:transient receptor potential cation channel subfamily M member 2 isoform X5 [Chelonoidis abingdonii]
MQTRMQRPELNEVCPDEGDSYVVHPKICDLEMVPNLRHSNSGFCKSKRKAHFATGNNEKENLSSWIPENIKKKECVYFVESSQMSDTGRLMCECGYPREQHLEEATKSSVFLGKEWDPKRHIQEMPTDAFGDISFAGLGPKVAKYVRVSADTPPCVIYQLMTQHWGLDVPNLLISVTGGAKNFNMMPRLKNIFRRGLVKVAQTTGAWIITGGSHAGVMKQVGEAVRDFSMSSSCKEGEIVTIGIATWGTVYNRGSLICPMGSFPAEYVVDEESQGNLSCLDSNHSHFILVDDGTHGRYGVEISLRTRLEKFISEQTKVKEGVAIKIPIVCVVLEGGPGTLDTIYNAITNGTPCVIVEGSGRVADVIAQVANRPVPEITISLIQKKLSILFRDTYELFTEGKIVEWTKKIQDIVRSRQLLTIFREGKDGQQDVDVAILQALLKASRNRDHFGHENWDHQLKLAVAWNRVDIARSEIFTDDHEWKAFLTKVWWGKLCVDNGLWRVILCMVFFPLIYTSFVTFREKRLQPMSSLTRTRAFFTAPVVIFHLNILSYFSFLWLFAYVLMIDFQETPSWREYFIYFWLFSLVCEETRQLFYDPDGFGLLKMASLYFSDFWNKLDVCAILIFIAGLTCRWIPSTLYPGRIILSLAFIIFCLRLMHIFTVSKTLGPKIIIVKRMMKDVFFFLFLLAVWVVSFGVAKQAILIHNEERVDWIFRGVVYHSYLTIFGQIPSYIDGVNFNLDQCSPNGTDPYKPKCPESNKDKRPVFPEWLTVILLCLYLLFTNILLLNLLIAMFNYTFQQVQEHTDQIWKFQRHDLIEEYHGRPSAPPPFILFNHLQLFVKRVLLRQPAKRHKQLKEKLEKNEEAALLSWEMYLKENYLQHQQCQEKQNMEQKIRDVAQRVDVLVELLDLDRVKRTGLVEQRLTGLEEQMSQTAKTLAWIVRALRGNGFGSEEDAPTMVPSKAPKLTEYCSEEKPEETTAPYHVSARNLLYPSSSTVRFPVPDEKVPWEVEFQIYDPPFYTADRKEVAALDPLRDSLESLSKINYNAMDGLINRQSFHGTYAIQNRLPLNPMGRTGLRGRGSLRFFGPNHALHPIVTCWRRNMDGSIYRKSLKKMLEVLVVKSPVSDHWALPGGSLEPGESLPLKLKRVLRREFWPQFQNLLNQGAEVYKGYVDDPRNTDNAWIETVAINVHFEDQNDVQMKRQNLFLQGRDPEPCVRWQLADNRIPLYTNHKELLQKVTTLLGAYY